MSPPWKERERLYVEALRFIVEHSSSVLHRKRDRTKIHNTAKQALVDAGRTRYPEDDR